MPPEVAAPSAAVATPPAKAAGAEGVRAPANVEDLAKTPVTLGVVLLLGGLLASGIGVLIKSILDIKETLAEMHITQLPEIEKQLNKTIEPDIRDMRGSIRRMEDDVKEIQRTLRENEKQNKAPPPAPTGSR